MCQYHNDFLSNPLRRGPSNIAGTTIFHAPALPGENTEGARPSSEPPRSVLSDKRQSADGNALPPNDPGATAGSRARWLKYGSVNGAKVSPAPAVPLVPRRTSR